MIVFLLIVCLVVMFLQHKKIVENQQDIADHRRHYRNFLKRLKLYNPDISLESDISSGDDDKKEEES